MNDQRWDAALKAAREAAEAAAEVIRHYWRRGVEVEIKSDATPVTIADREAEQAIRAVLAPALPGAAIYGEEFGLDGELGFAPGPPLGHALDQLMLAVIANPALNTQDALLERAKGLLT